MDEEDGVEDELVALSEDVLDEVDSLVSAAGLLSLLLPLLLPFFA